MCGRYTLSRPEGVPDLFEISETHIAPRFNIAPTQDAPIIRLTREGGRELARLLWGLVPYWSREDTVSGRMINARSDSLMSKQAFREPFRFRRCLVPADGFFEWRTLPGQRRKQPYHFHLSGKELFAFAGLWDRRSGSGGKLETFTIVTCDPNSAVRPVHDRMPVILPREAWPVWLSPETPVDLCQSLLVPWPAETMDSYPVTSAVNSPHTDDPSCVVPLDDASGPLQKGLFES